MSPRRPINPSWPRFGRLTFAPAVRHGNLLFISGLTASDDQGTLVGGGDVVAQTRRIYELMGEILAETGATFDNIVQTTDYITTTDGYRETAEVRREVFGANPAIGYPAATGVIVAV